MQGENTIKEVEWNQLFSGEMLCSRMPWWVYVFLWVGNLVVLLLSVFSSSFLLIISVEPCFVSGRMMSERLN